VRDDGTVVWKIKVGDEVRSAPAIGADGTVYATTLDGQLTAVGP
jgi:outer membrane protein assembly factor BamB